MNTLLRIITLNLAFLVGGVSVANAAFVDVTPVTAGSLIGLSGANGSLDVTYTPAWNAQVYFSNDANGDVSNQAAAAVQQTIETVFGLGTGSLSLSGQVDDAGGGSSASYTATNAYNFLAVHFGQHELFFRFLNTVNVGGVFTITTNGQAAGLSNFRAYSGVNNVPLPAAVWLFGSAFAGLMGFSRKRTKVV
mgnify:CR=1 FL=1